MADQKNDVTEIIVRFGPNQSLIGILSMHKMMRHDLPAILFLNSGILHHIGQNRLHVRMARHFAMRGFLSMRMDFSAIGDSPTSSQPGRIEERWLQEISAALARLKAFGAKEFIIYGNCSGARMALLAACSKARISAVIPVNLQPIQVPWLYYIEILFCSNIYWRKLSYELKHWERLRSFLAKFSKREASDDDGNRAQNNNTEDYQHEETNEQLIRQVLEKSSANIYLIHAQWDVGRRPFSHLVKRLKKTQFSHRLSHNIIADMDHDFFLRRGQDDLLKSTTEWLEHNYKNKV